jgi:hypothetical protein
MAQYPQLAALLRAVDPRTSEVAFKTKVVPYLVDVWIDDYTNTILPLKSEIVETTVSDFDYLFDLSLQRLVAALGISHGRHGEPRDAARMAGHPLSAGPLYHRGHAIPHTLGGPTDINLVTQLGKVNIGPFRPLEKKAVATPGSLYFTYWTYIGAVPAKDGLPGQIPTGVDQGLLIPGQSPQIVHHRN